MSDFGDSFSTTSDNKGDKELQEFLMVEKQKAQFNAQIHEFNDFCWDKCVEKTGNKLDSKTETCLTNCVDRFIDVSLLITNRSAECVISNLIIYQDLYYLPSNVKALLLRKLLRSCKTAKNLKVNETLSALIYPTLRNIDLSSINVNDDTLHILKKCDELTELNLRNYDNQSFSSKGLMELLNQTVKLMVLDVSNCKIFNDEVLTILSVSCKNLRELLAGGCSITDNGFTNFAQHTKTIECLTVSDTQITGEAIGKAVQNKNWRFLRELRLDNCPQVTDDALMIITENCPKLEILTFLNCDISDETLIFQHISNTCKKLKQLHWTITC